MSSQLNFTKATHLAEFYFCTIICNIGIVANLLNILVSTRKELQKNTMGFYNIVMSIFNILALIFRGYLTLFSQSINQPMLMLTSTFACVFISFFSKIFRFMSSWLLVMLTLDRLVCVSYKNTLGFLKDKRNLSWVVVVLLCVVSFLNLPSFFFYISKTTKYSNATNKDWVNFLFLNNVNWYF